MILAIALFLFQTAANRTPHVSAESTPFGGADYSAPPIWVGIIAVVAVLALLVAIFGFNPIWKKKGTGAGNVFKIDPPQQ